MNSKKIVILASFLAAAVVLIIAVNAISNRKPSEESLQFFPGLTEKNIGAVLLSDAADRVRIQRKGDVWVMVPDKAIAAAAPAPEKKTSDLARAMGADTGAAPVSSAARPPAGLAASEFPADSGTVALLLANVVKIKKDIMISENPARQADFEVNAGRGNRIEVFDIAGGSLGAVILGKSGDAYNSAYIRPENSKAVYRVNGCDRGAFSTDHKRFTDKSIMKFDKAAVKQLSIAPKGAPVMVLEKSLDTAARGWRMLKPVAMGTKDIDSNKVNEILNSLSNLNAQQVEDSAYSDSAAGLAEPSIAVTVALSSGTTRSLAIGVKKPSVNAFWGRVPEKQYTYLVNEDVQKKLDKKPADFKQQPPAPAAGKVAPAARPAAKMNPLSQEKLKKAVEEFNAKKNK
jgi:hypothetical protein